MPLFVSLFDTTTTADRSIWHSYVGKALLDLLPIQIHNNGYPDNSVEECTSLFATTDPLYRPGLTFAI